MQYISVEKPICCVKDMLERAFELQEKQGRAIYFRGQEYKDEKGKELKLLPTIGRSQKFVGRTLKSDIETERNLLHRFCRWAFLESKRALGEWEALFLARSHGLPVRLLDWTANPLSALYFAAKCEEPKGDAAVWAIVRKNKKEEQEDKVKGIDLLREESKSKIKRNDELYYHSKDELPISCKNKLSNLSVEDLQKPLRLKGVRLLYPFYSSPRMIVQNCFFTIQDNPWSPLENYEGKNQGKYIDTKKIFRWIVPEKYRWKIIKQLERLSIDNRTLFPDLDGLAKGLWQLEVIRQDNLHGAKGEAV